MASKEFKKVQDKQVIKLLASGKDKKEVSELVGLSQRQVANREKKYRELIKAESEKLFDFIPQITEQVGKDIKTSDKISKWLAGSSESNETRLEDPKDALKFLDYVLKQKLEVLKSAGILSSNVQNQYVQNIYQDNRQTFLNPTVLSALGGFLKSNEEIENAEFEEIDEDI